LYLFGGVLLGCVEVDGDTLYEPLTGLTPERTFLDSEQPPSGEVTGPVPSQSSEPPLIGDGETPPLIQEPPPADPDDTGDADDDVPPEPVDDVAPSIESTEPAAQATGVRGDAEIIVKFSEPMHRATTEAAYAGDLGDVSFSWTDEDTTLHIVPLNGLGYAEGPEPLAAQTYNVTIGASALDLAGNALDPSSFSFSTLRKVRLELSPSTDATLTGSWGSDGAAAACEDYTLCAGDQSSSSGPGPANETTVQYKAFVSFDLSALPDAMVSLESAAIEVLASKTFGAPFAGLGELHIERARFASIDALAFAADPEATLAVMSNEEDLVTSADIRWAIQESLASNELSQYRLTFPQATDSDSDSDLVAFEAESQVLRLEYLIP
jgi:hypothetical protein